jgi:hypothetical protein
VAYPKQFIALSNFELAFTRIVQGQNKEYKNFFRHLFSSYQLGLRDSLEDLIDRIRRGQYKPADATCVFKPKRSGVLRPLRLLNLEDQIVYQAIANVIATAFRPVQDKFALKRCFGAITAGKTSPFFYRGWRRCYRAFDQTVVRAFNRGNDYVADFDLVSFYELIDHNRLRTVLEKRIKSPELLDLLFECLERWTANDRGLCLRHGVPQGPEASAFLAECFLFGFDALGFKGVVYVRYVDDIRLMAKDEIPVRRALLRLDIASKEQGLVPQAQKIECRRVRNINELRKNIPSGVLKMSIQRPVSRKAHSRLEKMFRDTLKKERGRWKITDETKFKYALFRMKPRIGILRRIAPLLGDRPDLSFLFASYLRKFPANVEAANVIRTALQKDPTYDASAANYIDAMDICEPPGAAGYRRVIQTAERRSEEQSFVLRVATGTFRGRRSSGPKDARIVKREKVALAKSILIHRLFGDDPRAPFKIRAALSVIEEYTRDADADLARYCAAVLLDAWPWSRQIKIDGKLAHRAVKLLLKGIGLRARGPKRRGILEQFFQDQMAIGIKLTWRKALGNGFRDAENRCLRVQKLRVGDPSSFVLMVDTFNEALLQAFSLRHPKIKAAYTKAAGKNPHPDFGAWLGQNDLGTALPKGIAWFRNVHDARVKADLAHAKAKKTGVPTKPVSFRERERLWKGAQSAWAELILKWSKVI